MSIRKVAVLFALLGALLACRPVLAGELYCTDSNARNLRLEMYPFIPKMQAAAFTIKQLFEAGCPGLDLQIKLNLDYYAPDHRGIVGTDADVYEVDSVFFDDFLKYKSPKPLSPSLIDAAGPVVPFAGAIATANGVQFGIPHWICSEFMVYPKNIPEVGAIKTPADAARVFGRLGRGLLMDLKGPTTLGELYLSVLVARYGTAAEALKRLKSETLDDSAVNTLRSFVAMEPAGFGRDMDYHMRDGFYPRQFARGSGSAYVGYSEDTYYILDETAQSCRKNECLGQDDLAVANWPFADEGAKPVGWADMFMLDSKLTGAKLRDAEAFIKFMMKLSTYEAILVPPDSSPRYLLPARDDVFSDPKLASAKLYPQFRALVGSAIPVTEAGLNLRLHETAGKLDKMLPASH